mmetsp:Transcript_1753/g.1626  ORF Transcript_1753/g.1626 Transcript_1753/m.1626 type:complete len:88 (+) Transcript_1753:177-440(+)
MKKQKSPEISGSTQSLHKSIKQNAKQQFLQKAKQSSALPKKTSVPPSTKTSNTTTTKTAPSSGYVPTKGLAFPGKKSSSNMSNSTNS